MSPPELALLPPLIAGSAVVARQDVEADLVERLRRSERQAVAQAYEAHHDAVRGFARRLVGDEAAAEDVVHDTFLALPGALKRYRGDSALRTFVIGVAINHARRHIRSAARRRRAHERSGEVAALAADRDHRDEAMRRVLAQRLLAALDELPLDQRVAFVLCEVEQRTSQEVAAIVGVPEGTVRTRLFHARKKLQAALEDGR